MLRPKKCAAEWNPPVTASPCQPPLGKGAEGRGYGLPHQFANWSRNDTLQGVQCVGRAALSPPPDNHRTITAA